MKLTDIITGVFQEYQEDWHVDMCNRDKKLGKNLIEDTSLWSTSVPHPHFSGKCFTYKYINFEDFIVTPLTTLCLVL